MGLVFGYNQGYYQAIGVYPFAPRVDIVPPDITLETATQQTFEDVSNFIAEDITNKEPYQEGMNCVDFALMVVRNAQWQGLNSEIIRIDYEVGYSHAVLMFPTADEGYILLDPQTDKVFDVFRVGDTHDSKVITGLYLLRLKWIPLENFFAGVE